MFFVGVEGDTLGVTPVVNVGLKSSDVINECGVGGCVGGMS